MPQQIDPRPVGHHRIVCSCGRLISQCRCPGPHETQIRPHPACGIEPPMYPPEPELPSSPIGVGLLPGRKRPVLWEERDNTIVPLAYFVDREAMERYLAYNPRTDRRPKEPDAPAGS